MPVGKPRTPGAPRVVSDYCIHYAHVANVAHVAHVCTQVIGNSCLPMICPCTTRFVDSVVLFNIRSRSANGSRALTVRRRNRVDIFCLGPWRRQPAMNGPSYQPPVPDVYVVARNSYSLFMHIHGANSLSQYKGL